MKRGWWSGALAALVLWAAPNALEAQVADTAGAAPEQLSLEAALDRALRESEEVRIAGARLDAAGARERVAWSQALPQVNTQLAYTKTLRSVFQSASGFQVPDSLKFDPDPDAPLEERVRYLEERTPGAAIGALGSLFSDLPFGNENTWVAGLSIAQPVFAGGRIRSSIQAASHVADAAAAAYEEAASEVVLSVREAYYGAALAAARVEIVQQSVDLAREHLEAVRLRERAGRASELEVLRAEVDMENLIPQLVQARNGRDVALLNLKRLVNLPASQELELTTTLVPSEPSADRAVAVRLPAPGEAATQLNVRASVRGARSQVLAAQEQVDIARSAYLPTVSLSANLTRQAFPRGGFAFPGGDDWRDDWSVGFAVQWPLFSGLRRGAQMDEAQALRNEAQLELSRLREGLALEYEQAVGELERARAQISAAQRTVEQAERVYELTELRFDEGLATQLDVADARLALQQARLNEVQAWHDAQVALARGERALGIGDAR